MITVLKQTLRFDAEHHDDIVYPNALGFMSVHLASLGLLWSGVTWASVALCISLYLVRMFAITGGFHRYFSHRTFKTSRFFQFVLAFMGQTSLQQGVIWWSAKHRSHHKHSDTPEDVHSPKQHGFIFAHLGWIFSVKRGKADYALVKDLTEYPELVWLDKHAHIPGIALGVVCLLIAGWPGLFVGFFLSTSILYHGTFSINSLAHYFGRQRYVTGDDSRNNWWLAVITLGEGWHNNHHYYQSSTRQGFRWYEIDMTYYILRMLSWTGLVWDLRGPPPEVVRGERRLPRVAVDKIARELAGTFAVEHIAEQVRGAWAHAPSWPRWDDLPQVPSIDEIRGRAEALIAQTPSMDDIVARTREFLIEAVSVRLESPQLATA
ncbi:MAG: acyl-CoA desaturase [Gemmatimonadota bacterium]